MPSNKFKIKIKKMRENAKNILVASFYKEVQAGRSISSSKNNGRKINRTKFKKKNC